MSETVKRWVITHINKDGMRTLATAQQGRCTYATKEEAQAWIDAVMSNNSMDTIKSVFGLPLEPRECDCWAGHFDPVGVWFDDDEVTR